jgi:hypothetical protein
MFRILATFALICAFLQVAPLATAATDAQQNSAQPVNAVIEWNRTLLAIVRTPGAQPATIHSTRNFAILHAAIYDAVNNIDRKFSPYLVSLPNVPRTASEIAAADAAAHDVLVSLYPAFQASLDSELQQEPRGGFPIMIEKLKEWLSAKRSPPNSSPRAVSTERM